MPRASYYISDCCIVLVRFVFGHIMRWHPVKVQLPQSINISVDHVLPRRCLQLLCATGERFVFALLITSFPPFPTPPLKGALF